MYTWNVLAIIAVGVFLVFRSPNYHPIERRISTAVWAITAWLYLVIRLDPFWLWHWFLRL